VADESSSIRSRAGRAKNGSTGLQIEGTFRAHQVARSPTRQRILNTSSCWKDWLRSYRPEDLFDQQGRLKSELAELAPKGERRMGANPHASTAAFLLRDLRMPDFRDYAVEVPSARSTWHRRTPCVGQISCAMWRS